MHRAPVVRPNAPNEFNATTGAGRSSITSRNIDTATNTRLRIPSETNDRSAASTATRATDQGNPATKTRNAGGITPDNMNASTLRTCTQRATRACCYDCTSAKTT